LLSAHSVFYIFRLLRISQKITLRSFYKSRSNNFIAVS
jgi:hypothetical protein